MEALLVRIDHFHDRALYVATVKGWLEAISGSGTANGRLVTMGDVHLLFVEAPSGHHETLLQRFATEPVDTNARGEPCVDRFIDVVGRKPIDKAVCKGFLEMNVLNAMLLERLLVGDWHCDKQWLDDALSTPRTKALIRWRDEAKNARKDRRKRAAQDRDAERAAKRAKAEEEKARLEAAKLAGEDDEEGDNNGDDEDKDKPAEDDASGDEASVSPTPPAAKAAKAPSKPSSTGKDAAQPQKIVPQGNPNNHKHSAKGSGPAKNQRPPQASQHHHNNKKSGPRPPNGKKHNSKKA